MPIGVQLSCRAAMQVPWEQRVNRVTSATFRMESGAVGALTHTVLQHEQVSCCLLVSCCHVSCLHMWGALTHTMLQNFFTTFEVS